MGNERPDFGYNISVKDVITKRKSIRTYSKDTIANKTIDNIREYISTLKGPFSTDVKIELLIKPELKSDKGIRLGTYGVIQGACVFIAAAVKKDEPRNMEQLGYVFEDLVLYITSLGLGTCWLGGTFNREGFGTAMNIKDDEFLPIVSPVGYASKIRSPIDYIFKTISPYSLRKPWGKLFFSQSINTEFNRDEAGAYAFVLDMVRLAPSASNRQPWRIIKINNNFNFYVSHDALYASSYPYDIQKVDMGIAMLHFEVSAKEAGLNGEWSFYDPLISDLPKGFEYIITWSAR